MPIACYKICNEKITDYQLTVYMRCFELQKFEGALKFFRLL